LLSPGIKEMSMSHSSIRQLPQPLVHALFTAFPEGPSPAILERAAFTLLRDDGLAELPEALAALAADLISSECGWDAEEIFPPPSIDSSASPSATRRPPKRSVTGRRARGRRRKHSPIGKRSRD
jgi:hypothetical protein